MFVEEKIVRPRNITKGMLFSFSKKLTTTEDVLNLLF